MPHRVSSPYRKALARFEHCLETPIIPGELPNWVIAARNACREVHHGFRALRDSHEELLGEIAQQDPELLSRVETLRSTDEELRGRLERLQARFDELAEQAAAAEPEEAPLNEEIDDLTTQALSVVIDARTQETAMTTWYLEAFDRDRGVGD